MNKFPFTKDEFDEIYSKVPRVSVEIIVRSEEGIYLTLRDIEPCKGQWHLPGGTVYFGEFLLDTVKRIAKRELGIDVLDAKSVGFIEYPGHFQKGLDHPVGVVFEVTQYEDSIEPNEEATHGEWFKRVPANLHADQNVFLKQHGYLRS